MVPGALPTMLPVLTYFGLAKLFKGSIQTNVFPVKELGIRVLYQLCYKCWLTLT